MPSSSFTAKQLRITFTLANQIASANANDDFGPLVSSSAFNSAGDNQLVLTGLRMIVNVKAAGAPIAPTAQAQIFGMRQADMNLLTMLAWKPLGLQRNNMLIEANAGDGWVNVFSGQIIEAGPDYAGAPDVMLRVQAVSLYFENLNPAIPTSYTGATDVATIISNLASAMGKTFENNGVSVQLANPYLPNTLGEQLKTVCAQAGIDYYIDGDVIAICPRGQPRRSQQVLINANTGLIGYPTIDKVGIQFACLYNSGLRFGGPVHVESDVPKANGDWYIYSLDHHLESEKPGGAWFSSLGCSEFGRTVVL